MSERNGDRARFHKNRKRRLRHRRRLKALLTPPAGKTLSAPPSVNRSERTLNHFRTFPAELATSAAIAASTVANDALGGRCLQVCNMRQPAGDHSRSVKTFV